MSHSLRNLLVIIIVWPSLLFAAEQSDKRLITVSGDAEVRVVPDEVSITLGVETSDMQLNIAKEDNDQKIQDIIDVAEKYKLDKKHIQTDYLDIEPRYRDNYEHKDFKGYFVRKTIVITLKDTSIFESVLSDMLEAGANHAHGINFRTTELRKHKDRARALAIQAAKEKAQDLAQALDQDVGIPHAIHENRTWSSGYGGGWGARWFGGMSQNTIQNTASGSSGGNGAIALGQIKVNATVTVSFELK